jgi:two-component system, chemotaxis family, protein-glutamate methylesterase/glutaminase
MNIIVIGGSAGSLNSLKKITSNLSENIDAAIFIVVHFPPGKTSYLSNIINRHSLLFAEPAVHQKTIESGKIYVAVPDRHLFIKGNKMYLGNGPKENRFRPAIDVLFRSAALEYGPKVTGIILSGLLDDGTIGLNVIKEMNGIAIVHDPKDAEFTHMPITALQSVEVDYCVPAVAISDLINSGLINSNEKLIKKYKART